MIDIEAYNTLNTRDTASLATASFFAGGGAESNMTANATLTVNIHARELFSVGKIFIGTAAKMAASNNANASLYGAIAGVGASTNTWVHADQDVNVFSGTTIQAWRDINIFAGMSGDTITFSSIQATATTVVYNNTAHSDLGALPRHRQCQRRQQPDALPTARACSACATSIWARRRGRSPRPAMAAITIRTWTSSAPRTATTTATPAERGDVALNGLVVAGINNDLTITIELGASAPTLSTTSPYCRSPVVATLE